MKIVRTSTFKRDYKRAVKRNFRIENLVEIISRLARGDTLEVKHRNHRLSGDFRNCLECHITSDWLLIYQIKEDELILIRTGTHNDLFE